MVDLTFEHQVRVSAFEWLARQVNIHGEVLTRDLLVKGFNFRDHRVPLMSPQGIFKPAILHLPISITTVYEGPYDDSLSENKLLAYRYRGTDPSHPDNLGLRTAMQKGLPLVYFHAVLKGRYLAAWPVYIVGDDPHLLTFRVALDDFESDEWYAELQVADSAATEGRRVYITSTFRRRLHQQSFRERVLRAYRDQCALCRLRHRELLDAAHIVPDSEPQGEPLVKNGLALCKLHHAAFDKFILGITPDHLVEVRSDVLEEADGPMLKYGLQGLHHQKITIPRARGHRPDRNMLAWRYERFLTAY